MKIVSTTLTGNSEAIIGPALESVVGWVDTCLVVDTGVTDRSLSIAAEICGDKLAVREFPWQNDFSKARNFSLEAAEQMGADWALIVDTDERVEPSGEDLRALLSCTEADLVLMPDRQENYTKERAVRLPCPSRYEGPTHEAFLPPPSRTWVTERARFFELPKSPEANVRKFERDVALLEEYTAQHPDRPRWFYYLGDTLKNLGRYRDAIEAYSACTALRGWDEESAWACFRAAQCHEELGEYAAMVDVLVVRMSRHAGLAELMWYAGYACLRMRRPRQAVYWARLAIPFGHFRGEGAGVPRIGFRHPPGLFEGPYDVLRFALKELGDDDGAARAERDFQAARQARGHCDIFSNR